MNKPYPRVALSPHSDDLAFSLAGALWDGRFGELLPLTVFTVSNFNYADIPPDVEIITNIRKREDRGFYRKLSSCQPPNWLDYRDAPLRLGIHYLQALTVPLSPGDELEVERIAADIKEILQPGGLLIAPLGLGNHIDHRLTTLAACKLTDHGGDMIFYEDMPYAAKLEEQEIRQAVEQVESRIGVKLEPELLPSPTLIKAKEWAVQSYASQIYGEFLNSLLTHASRLRVEGICAERIWKIKRQ